MSQPNTYYKGPPLSKKLARDPKRKQRLLNGQKLVLYHQTSPTIAQKILSTGEFLRGSNGIVGGGIYFAETAQATNLKAQQQGQILKAEILVGNVKVEQYSSLTTYTFTQLAKLGYDTVKVTGRSTGIEYIIYNYDQVKQIGKHGQNGWVTDGKYYQKISSYQNKYSNSKYNNNNNKYSSNNNSKGSTVSSVMFFFGLGNNNSNSNSYKTKQFLDKQTRAKRLKKEKLVECFYLASDKEAQSILNTKKIYRSKGKCGEGIYFYENKPRKYDRKKYVLLRCLIQIGINLKLKKANKNIGFRNLASNGYDSVYYDDQYIIYNYDQIFKVDKYDKNYDKKHKRRTKRKHKGSDTDSESSDSSDNSNRKRRKKKRKDKDKRKHKHRKRSRKDEKEIQELKDQISQLTDLVTQLAKNQGNNQKNNKNNKSSSEHESGSETEEESSHQEKFDEMYEEDDAYDGVSD